MTKPATGILLITSTGTLNLVLRPLGRGRILEALSLPRENMAPDEIERALEEGTLNRVGYAEAALPYGTLYVTKKPYESFTQIQNSPRIRLSNICHLHEADRPDPVADVVAYLESNYPRRKTIKVSLMRLELRLREAKIEAATDDITDALEKCGFVGDHAPGSDYWRRPA